MCGLSVVFLSEPNLVTPEKGKIEKVRLMGRDYELTAAVGAGGKEEFQQTPNQDRMHGSVDLVNEKYSASVLHLV